MYNEKIAAQVAAFFLYKAGGTLSVLKLIKLMYLAERLSLKKYGEPITDDVLFSLPHGPILSTTLDLINGFRDSTPGGWDEWITDREGRTVSLADRSMIRTPEQDLRALSDTDLEVLNEIWDEFGHFSAIDLRNYTHKQCSEWNDPKGSRVPIPYKDVLSAVGFSGKQAEVIADQIAERHTIDAIFTAAAA